MNIHERVNRKEYVQHQQYRGLSDDCTHVLPETWVKVQNFQNPELKKFKCLNLQIPAKINTFMFKWLNVFR